MGAEVADREHVQSLMRLVEKLERDAKHTARKCGATELQALFRESALIKSVKPPFNRALRKHRRELLEVDAGQIDAPTGLIAFDDRGGDSHAFDLLVQECVDLCGH